MPIVSGEVQRISLHVNGVERVLTIEPRRDLRPLVERKIWPEIHDDNGTFVQVYRYAAGKGDR